jgi:hypothetical protein
LLHKKVINANYAPFTAAIAVVDSAVARSKGTEQEMPRNARPKLMEFNEMHLANKHAVQRRLKAAQCSEHAMADEENAEMEHQAPCPMQ